MADRNTKTSKAIKRLLSDQDGSQLSLFEVSDNPLREAIFEQENGSPEEKDEEEK